MSRDRAPAPIYHVVLHEPLIPNNTGNIGRTCVATGCALHLIRPLGFSTSAKACRRAGLDYWARLAPREHDSWEAYLADAQPARVWLFTTRSSRPAWDAQFRPGDHLVFGQETRGLPAPLLHRYAQGLVTLPMRPRERSLNLATAVCAAVYEALRQAVQRRQMTITPRGRLGAPRAARVENR